MKIKFEQIIKLHIDDLNDWVNRNVNASPCSEIQWIVWDYFSANINVLDMMTTLRDHLKEKYENKI